MKVTIASKKNHLYKKFISWLPNQKERVFASTLSGCVVAQFLSENYGVELYYTLSHHCYSKKFRTQPFSNTEDHMSVLVMGEPYKMFCYFEARLGLINNANPVHYTGEEITNILNEWEAQHAK